MSDKPDEPCPDCGQVHDANRDHAAELCIGFVQQMILPSLHGFEDHNQVPEGLVYEVMLHQLIDYMISEGADASGVVQFTRDAAENSERFHRERDEEHDLVNAKPATETRQ